MTGDLGAGNFTATPLAGTTISLNGNGNKNGRSQKW